jgi:hypothetical protein
MRNGLYTCGEPRRPFDETCRRFMKDPWKSKRAAVRSPARAMKVAAVYNGVCNTADLLVSCRDDVEVIPRLGVGCMMGGVKGGSWCMKWVV